MATKRVVYFRMKGITTRSWYWTRKVTKRATPLKRMWKKEEEAVESTALVPVRPAPMVAVMAPMVPKVNLSGAKAIADSRMAG